MTTEKWVELLKTKCEQESYEKLIELRLIKSRYNVLIGNYQEALDDIDLILMDY